MTEMPPPNYTAPPAAAPAKRKIPVWAIIVGVVALLCVCGACAVFASPAIFGGVMGGVAGGQLPQKCQDNTDLGVEECSAWTQTVVSEPEFQTCVQELMGQGSLDADALYNCLVENGVGPE